MCDVSRRDRDYNRDYSSLRGRRRRNFLCLPLLRTSLGRERGSRRSDGARGNASRGHCRPADASGNSRAPAPGQDTSLRDARELEASLQKAEAEAREQAYRFQRFYAASLADHLGGVQADLEQDPPNVTSALERVRRLLDGERPAA